MADAVDTKVQKPIVVEGVPVNAGKGADDPDVPDMSLLSITDGETPRGIPIVKFVDDVGAFAESFTPPAPAELLVGAYSELHAKFKTYETSLIQKRELLQELHSLLRDIIYIVCYSISSPMKAAVLFC